MRTVIQRVQHASVTIDGTVKSSIGKGFLLLLGVEETDTSEDVDWLVKKVAALRVFDDENGVMNRSILDVEGEALVVSQFTLYASTRRAPARRGSAQPATKSPYRSTRSSAASSLTPSDVRSAPVNSAQT